MVVHHGTRLYRLKNCRTLQPLKSKPFKTKLLGSLSELPKKSDSMMSLGQFETHEFQCFKLWNLQTTPCLPSWELTDIPFEKPAILSRCFSQLPMLGYVFWFPGPGTWRIIPFSKWLITMVSKSPKWVISLPNGLNRGYYYRLAGHLWTYK